MSLQAITDAVRRLGSVFRSVLLILVAVSSWWLAETFGPSFEKAVKLKPGSVDYFAKHLQRTVFDPTGRLKEYLESEEMVHYDTDNRAELSTPVITLYVKEGPPWVIHSESATIPGEGPDILLNGEVLVLRDADKNGRTMRIETRNVRAQPSNDYAETDEDIRVISPPDYMTGTGAKLKFGDGIQYSVLASVRRKHDVQD